MRFVLSRLTEPGFHLAAEEYFFLRQSEEILFLYVNEPCVVVGCNQSILAEADTEYCASQGIGLYRRLSGGGAVYHDLGNLNFCFIHNRVPGESPLGAAFLNPIIAALQSMDIPVTMGSRKDLWLPGGLKVSGTASHVGKLRELHHGTLLYDASLDKLLRCLTPLSSGKIKAAVASVPSPVGNIRSFLQDCGCEVGSMMDFVGLFVKALHTALPGLLAEGFSEQESEEIHALAQKTYLSTAWTFKK